MTWGSIKIERTPRPYLTRCPMCGWQFRVDQEPYSYETSPFTHTNPPRPNVTCRNVDCRMGPAARALRSMIRDNPCPGCMGEGTVSLDGIEYYCEVDGCESARLL
jgi:hypothetical protein